MSEKQLYAIHALDGVHAHATRSELYDAHRTYLSDHGTRVELRMSGPLFESDDPGAKPIGSLFLIEASSLAEAQSFNENDPFSKGGVWHTVTIRRFVRRR